MLDTCNQHIWVVQAQYQNTEKAGDLEEVWGILIF